RPVGPGRPDRGDRRPALRPGLAAGDAGVGAFRPTRLVGHRPGGPVRRVPPGRLAPRQPAAGRAVAAGQLAPVGPPAGRGGRPPLVVVAPGRARPPLPPVRGRPYAAPPPAEPLPPLSPADSVRPPPGRHRDAP